VTTPKLTEEMCHTALRKALEAEAARAKGKRTPWTPEMDRDIVYARDELRLSWGAIGRVLRKANGWGSRSAVENRYRQLKEAGDA
jgi:hypothetical protein